MYHRESGPVQGVYEQVTQLLNSAPDLVEDFNQFLPESVAHVRLRLKPNFKPKPGLKPKPEPELEPKLSLLSAS